MTLRNFHKNEDEIDFSLLSKLLIKLLKRNLIPFFSISITFFLGCLLYLFSLKPIFVGENTLYFHEETNNSKKFVIDFLRSLNPEKSINLILSMDANEVAKKKRIILIPTLKEVNSLNLKNEKEELSLKEFTENLKIINSPGSNSIKFSYQNHDKELVLKSLKIISNNYVSFAKELNLNDFEKLSFFYQLNKLPMISKNKEIIDKKLEQIKNSPVLVNGESPIIKDKIYEENILLIILGLVSSLFIPLIIILFKEKLIGNIFVFDLNLINCKFIHSIPLSQKSISKNLLKNIFSKIDSKDLIGVIYADSLFLEKEPSLSKFIHDARKKVVNIDISKQEIINSCDHFLIILQDGNCKYNNIDLINSCMPLIKEKTIGWILFN